MFGNLIEIRSDLSIFTDQFSEVVHVCNNFNLVIDLLSMFKDHVEVPGISDKSDVLMSQGRFLYVIINTITKYRINKDKMKE